MLNLILVLCIILLLLPVSLKRVLPYFLIGIAGIFLVYGIGYYFNLESYTYEIYLQSGLLILILLLGIVDGFLFLYRKIFCRNSLHKNSLHKDGLDRDVLCQEGQKLGADGFYPRHEIWMDLLKVVSAMMIVFIHSSGSIYVNYFGDRTIWMEALIVNSIPRFAVPCFFMISGIVLLRREYTGRQVAGKIVRVLVPLVFWSVLSILVRKILWNEGNVIRDILLIPLRRADGVMWYAYQLIWVYLSLPVLTKMYRSFSVRERRYFILLTLLVPSGINFVIQLFSLPVELAYSSTNLYLTVQYWGLLFLGRYLYDTYREKPISLWNCGFMIGIGIVGIVGSTYFVSMRKGSPVNSIFEELSLPVLFYGSGVLLLVYRMRDLLDRMSGFCKKGIEEIASVSLGIYFMHCMVIWIFYSFCIVGISFSRDAGIWQMLLCAVCYYLISLVLALLIKQIPFVKRLVA